MQFGLPTLRGQSRFCLLWGAVVWCASGAAAFGQVLQVINPSEAAQINAPLWFATAYSLDANSFASTKGVDYLLGDQVYLADIQYAPRSGKNFAIREANYTLGYQIPGWRLSVFQKQSLWLDIEEKTLDLLYVNMANRNLDPALALSIDAQFVGYQTRGINLEKAFVFPVLGDQTLTLGVGANFFVGTDLRMTRAQGVAQQTATGFLYSVNTNDSFSDATYPYIRQATVSADGYSLDWGLRYRLNANHTLALAVNDDFSSVTWRNMPNSQLSVSNKKASKDVYGFTQPSLTGMNDVNRRTITQALEPKYQVSWIYQADQSSWSAYGQWTHQQMMAGINYGWCSTGAHWLELGWEQTFKALSLAYKGPYFKLKFQTQQPFADQTAISQMSLAAFLDF